MLKARVFQLLESMLLSSHWFQIGLDLHSLVHYIEEARAAAEASAQLRVVHTRAVQA